MRSDLLTSLRLVLGTLLLCGVLYPAVLFGVAQAVVPNSANGSLLEGPAGRQVGSALIAQEFTRPEFLWPRPSAAGYDAAAATGSNLAASNPALRRRAAAEIARLAPVPREPIPAELVTASGSGLDPHVTLDAALYQAQRIARARGVQKERVEEILRLAASPSTPWSPRLVNVLEANLALDQSLGKREADR